MKKTIRIDNLEDVFIGDMVVVSGLPDASFEVTAVSLGSDGYRLRIDSPFYDGRVWLDDERFDHAERTVEEPEWPHTGDIDMHVYLGADGEKYIYMLLSDIDEIPWARLPIYDTGNIWQSAESMIMDFPEALPLKELKLVPKEEES